MIEHENLGKVLIVEDSEPLRKVLAEKLRDEGYAIVEAGGGDEGYKLSLEEKPAIIISDLVMFPMDGIEMTRKIREAGSWGENVPIIALTNQSENEEQDRATAAGITQYFVKADTSLDQVVAYVKDALHPKKGHK